MPSPVAPPRTRWLDEVGDLKGDLGTNGGVASTHPGPSASSENGRKSLVLEKVPQNHAHRSYLCMPSAASGPIPVSRGREHTMTAGVIQSEVGVWEGRENGGRQNTVVAECLCS